MGGVLFALPPGGEKVTEIAFRREFSTFLAYMRRTYNRKVYRACIQMLQPGAPFECAQRVRQLQANHEARCNVRSGRMASIY